MHCICPSPILSTVLVKIGKVIIKLSLVICQTVYDLVGMIDVMLRKETAGFSTEVLI